jgi:hypothetical protein
MEKINALIDKLLELKNSGADLATISYYVQLLQAEILHVRTRQHVEQLGKNSSVAVILPVQQPVAVSHETEAQTTTLPPINVAGKPATPAEVINNTAPVEGKPVTVVITNNATPDEVPPMAANNHIAPAEEKPVTATEVTDINTAAKKYEVEDINSRFRDEVPLSINTHLAARQSESHHNKTTEPAPTQSTANIPEPIKQVSTETQQKQTSLFESHTPPTTAPKKEAGAQPGVSLNERLKQQQVEVAQKLGGMPVNDLRQAIGINDKYQFIDVLFNGDKDLYERSIKTINEFGSFQEADHWIQREIMIIQGWQEDNRLVQQFYSLLRKRFS